MENSKQQRSQDLIKQINTSIDFKRLLGELMNKWYWFALALFVSLSIAFFYLRYTTPIYSMQSTVMIEQNNATNPANTILTKFASGSSASGADNNLFNEIFTMRSQDLITLVVDSMDMNIQYFAQGRIREDELYQTSPIKVVFDSNGYLGGTGFEIRFKNINENTFELEEAVTQQFNYGKWISRPYGRFKIDKSSSPERNLGYLDNQTPVTIRILPMKSAMEATLGKFNVSVSDGRTSMLALTYSDNLQRRGVDFLNTLIFFYRIKELENLNLSAEKQREIIERYKKAFAEKLRTQDSAAAQIKIENDLIDIPTQTTSLVSEKNLEEQTIKQLSSQKQTVELLKQNVLFGAGAREEIIAGVRLQDPYLTALVAQYNELVQKREAVLRNTGILNPTYLKLGEDIEASRKQISDACDRVTSSLNVSIQNAQNNIAQSETVLKTLPEAEIDITESKREYPVLMELYLYIYQRGVENDIKQYATTNKSKIIVAPYASDAPIKPVKQSIYSIVIMLSLLIPASIIIGKVLLNTKVINENDVENLTTIPIIGAIARADEGNAKNKHVVVGPHVRTAIAEQFRLIRANLEFMSVAGNKKVYLITSSMSGEGKTFISLNLGLTMTLAKKRVVIMEFDLRKPKLSNYLGLQTDGGISGYLAGIGGISSAVKPSGVHENLYIANCGPIPPNPGELLVLPSTKELIEELTEMFDVVIMDTAPIGLVSDALILSKYSDINMFVVRQSYTIKEQIKLFDNLYIEGKIKNPAIIFNGVEYLKKYGYGSGYGYSSSYGAGYYTEDMKKGKKKKLVDILLKR